MARNQRVKASLPATETHFLTRVTFFEMKRATIETRCSSEDVWKYIKKRKKGNNNFSHVSALQSKNKHDSQSPWELATGFYKRELAHFKMVTNWQPIRKSSLFRKVAESKKELIYS